MSIVKSLYLLGYMGAGKSRIGASLSKKLGLAFEDTDRLIEKQEGQSVKELFESRGEAYFRELENRCLQELTGKETMVIATGGGMPCNDNNIEMIRRYGHSIYLSLDAGHLVSRLLEDGSKRPLLKKYDTRDDLLLFIKEHLRSRERYYLQADYTIDASGTVEQVIQKLFQLPLFNA